MFPISFVDCRSIVIVAHHGASGDVRDLAIDVVYYDAIYTQMIAIDSTDIC